MRYELIKDFLAGAGNGFALVLCSDEQRDELIAQGLLADNKDTTLSMQHLNIARLAAQRLHDALQGKQLLAVTPEADTASPAERALIYAMLVRCRKVISCRDKLEDMLKYDDREGWQAVKAEYENKVLDLYKATWRDEIIYPYNIVDNIKEYNKNESYILKQLYWHLSERTPGKINTGDKEMTCALRQMFSDLSVSLLVPDVVFVGSVESGAQLQALAEYQRKQNISINKL